MAKFKISKVDITLYTAELLEILKILRCESENEGLIESWQFCGHSDRWHTDWPFFYQLVAEGTCYFDKHIHM
jgi:hypothetical protein